SGTERLADVAEDRVDRVLETQRERGVAEGLDRPVGAGGVRYLLAVFDAVAGVVEGRFGGELVRIQSRRRGDDLERRPRREEAVGRAVQQRRRRVAGRSGRLDQVEMVLDEVRVVGRLRGKRVDL